MALVAATVVPAAPLRRPREQAAVVVRKVADLLRAASEVMVDGEVEPAMELLADARSTDYLIRELQAASDEGLAVVASSPFRVRHRAGMRRMSTWWTRSTGRCAAPGCWCGRPRWRRTTDGRCPHAYALLAADLADAGRPGGRRARRRPDGRRGAAARAGGRAATGQVERADDLSAEVILAQLRSVVADLLLLTGMEPLEATDALPPPPELSVPATDASALVGAARRPRPVHRGRRDAAAPRARGPAGGGRRARGPDRAGRGRHRVVRRPGVRRRVRDAAAGGRARKCPDAVFLPVDGPAYDAASAVVMDTLRVARVGRRAGGARGARLGRGVPRAAGAGHGDLGDPVAFAAADPRRGAGRDPAALLGRHRRQQAAGQDRHRLRQAARASTGSSDDTWVAVMGERPTEALWGIGRKTAQAARRARHRDRGPARRTPTPGVLAAELGPTMGPWYRRLGRGVDSSPVDPTPYVARAHGREATYQVDLEDWARIAEEVRALTAPGGRRHRRGGAARRNGSASRCGASRSSPSRAA